MLAASLHSTTAEASTSHMRATLLLTPSGSGRSVRRTKASGWMPMERRVATECWVGLVLSSPAAGRKGMSETCTNATFSRPRSARTWRAASRNGWDSMSPTVPPISVMMTSGTSPSAPGAAWARMTRLISSVMCGMT